MVMFPPFHPHVPQHPPWCIQPVIPCFAAPFVVQRAVCPAQSCFGLFLLYYWRSGHDIALRLAS